MKRKKKINEGVVASYSILVNTKGELISEVSTLPEDKSDILKEVKKKNIFILV